MSLLLLYRQLQGSGGGGNGGGVGVDRGGANYSEVSSDESGSSSPINGGTIVFLVFGFFLGLSALLCCFKDRQTTSQSGQPRIENRQSIAQGNALTANPPTASNLS